MLSLKILTKNFEYNKFEMWKYQSVLEDWRFPNAIPFFFLPQATATLMFLFLANYNTSSLLFLKRILISLSLKK